MSTAVFKEEKSFSTWKKEERKYFDKDVSTFNGKKEKEQMHPL
jgi:hypothetical protein